MNLTKFKKLKFANILTTLLLIQNTICFATSNTQSSTTGIGTQEVQTATDNIKRVITSIAMPLGRSFNLCKCCNCCN